MLHGRKDVDGNVLSLCGSLPLAGRGVHRPTANSPLTPSCPLWLWPPHLLKLTPLIDEGHDKKSKTQNEWESYEKEIDRAKPTQRQRGTTRETEMREVGETIIALNSFTSKLIPTVRQWISFLVALLFGFQACLFSSELCLINLAFPLFRIIYRFVSLLWMLLSSLSYCQFEFHLHI